jgi:hypothetical protein
MTAVGLIGVGQPRPRFAQVGDCLARCLRAKGLENSFVEGVNKLLRSHSFLSSSARYGGHYFNCAFVHDGCGRPFRTTNDFSVDRHGYAARLNL